GPVLWEGLEDRRADREGALDALDAPATEGADAEVGVVAAAAVGGNLEQEDRALVHDGDDRRQDAVAQARNEQAWAALKNVRQSEEGSVDTDSADDGVERLEEAAAAVVGSDGRDVVGEDAVVILLAEERGDERSKDHGEAVAMDR
ncbi:hypothetical protein FZEAL_10990, partial [Fusarium zealandicum]